MTVNFAHCFFEQSGTFRDAFRALDVPALDYDIANDFGETDLQMDLFEHIDNAFSDKASTFDHIKQDHLIIAFFPCTYFCENNNLFFMGVNTAWRNLSTLDKIERIIERDNSRHNYYVKLLQLCHIVERRGLRMIVENPYNAHHYWRFNFPYKPAVIDMNRRRMGDYFPKPTQYLFINCSPAGKHSLQMDKAPKYVRKERGATRSLISPDYAHNFICDHILGIDSGHTQPTLF